MKNIENATFAGGCFWCMVKPFDDLPGIVRTVKANSVTGASITEQQYTIIMRSKEALQENQRLISMQRTYLGSQ